MNYPEISCKGQYLYLDDKEISPDIDPAILERALKTGKAVVLAAIDDYHQKMIESHPGYIVISPSMFLSRLGSESRRRKILTPKGYRNNTAVHNDKNEIVAQHHGIWDAVSNSGFTPEVRSSISGKREGVWLMLSAPEDEQ